MKKHSTLNLQRRTSHGRAAFARRALERFDKSRSLDGKSVGKFREVFDCGSPLPLWGAGAVVKKRQRAAAVQDAGAQFDCLSLFGGHGIFENALTVEGFPLPPA
jgi:hypothetical protein